MAFITDAGGTVISFAEFTDVVQKDQRVLESNNLKIPARKLVLQILLNLLKTCCKKAQTEYY